MYLYRVKVHRMCSHVISSPSNNYKSICRGGIKFVSFTNNEIDVQTRLYGVATITEVKRFEASIPTVFETKFCGFVII